MTSLRALNPEPDLDIRISDPPLPPGAQGTQRPQLALSMELPWAFSLPLTSSLPRGTEPSLHPNTAYSLVVASAL